MISKKICMIGAFGVGKTSLVARFVESIFSEKYLTTVGVKIDKKVVSIAGEVLTLVIWDLAGEDALTTVRPSHLRGAAGYILVMDGTRKTTLSVASSLQQRAVESLGPVPFVCVLNKDDIRPQWEVDEADIKELTARRWRVLYTSAKTGEGVEAIFSELGRAILKEHLSNGAAASPETESRH